MTFGGLEFKPVTEADIAEINQFLKISQYEESNHNIVNLFMWRSWFPIWKHVTDHYCLLLGIHQGTLFLYMPLCQSEYFDEAIVASKQLFQKTSVPYVLSCYTEEGKNRVLERFPEFCFCESRDSFDYVYSREKLITLSGKKLQKRRNHLNAFYKLYSQRYQFVEIKDYINESLDFLENWKNGSEDEYLSHERLGTQYILQNWDLFNASGGCILIDNQVHGFIIGSSLSDRMIQINIEKADESIRGIYQTLEREFLLRYYPTIEWVNREDDMGFENLRQAKLASQPAWLIAKYRLCEEVKHDCKSQCQG